MSPRRLLLFQVLLEALIPVIGYFEWEWDLSFILLFYLLDWLLAFGILIAKGRKRVSYSNDAAERRLLGRRALAGFALMIFSCAGFGLAVLLLLPELSWSRRFIDFLAYKDLGIEQGYLLVPLMLLNGILLYRQQFLMTARYRVWSMEQITQPFVRQAMVLFGSAGVLLGAASLLAFPQEVAIFSLIAGIGIYRWFDRQPAG